MTLTERGNAYEFTFFHLIFSCVFVGMFVNVCVFHPQVQLFFESIKEQALQLRATQVALDNVQKNVRWFQRNTETLRNWLNKQMK